MILTEAIIGKIIKAAARQVLKGKTLAKQVAKQTGQTPKQLKFGKTFHGTTQKASDAITKGGWKTDTNVTRQMAGSKVYTAGDNYSAAHYAINRATKLKDKPAMRKFRIPQSVMQKQTQRASGGVGDYSGKGYKITTLSPQQANKYDVTDKAISGKYDLDSLMSPDNKRQLKQRVKAALRKKQNVDVLKREIKQGNEASLNNLYQQRNNPQNPNTLENELRGRYRGKGTGRKERI